MIRVDTEGKPVWDNTAVLNALKNMQSATPELFEDVARTALDVAFSYGEQYQMRRQLERSEGKA